MEVALPGNRDERDFTPRVPWTLTWTVAVALFVVSLHSCEFAWRALGYRPSVIDSPGLWKYWYEHACSGRQAIAIIGSSRVQTGLSVTELRRRLPQYRVAQLGREGGGSAIGVLRALAADDRFKGIVICDTLTPFLVRSEWHSQSQYYECHAGLRERTEAILSACAFERFAVMDRDRGIRAGVQQLLVAGSLPSRRRFQMTADRCLAIDFAMVADLEKLKASGAARYRNLYEKADFPLPEDLEDELRDINDFVCRIRSRGGQVVFVRMPSAGARLELEEEYHPKARYWDRFAKIGNGIFIHASDLEPGTFRCPDDTHLDPKGAATFTNALLAELLERRVFAEP